MREARCRPVPPEDAEIRTTTTRRIAARGLLRGHDPYATVRITNIRLDGQPQRGIQSNPSREDMSIEFDYSVRQPGGEKTVQLIVGVGTYSETFDLVHEGKVGPAGLVGHYQGTLRIPAEVRQSVEYPGRACGSACSCTSHVSQQGSGRSVHQERLVRWLSVPDCDGGLPMRNRFWQRQVRRDSVSTRSPSPAPRGKLPHNLQQHALIRRAVLQLQHRLDLLPPRRPARPSSRCLRCWSTVPINGPAHRQLRESPRYHSGPPASPSCGMRIAENRGGFVQLPPRTTRNAPSAGPCGSAGRKPA